MLTMRSTVKPRTKQRGRPRINRNYSYIGKQIPEALKAAKREQGLSARTQAFLRYFATVEDAVLALRDYSDITVSPALLRKAANGKIKSSAKLNKAMGFVDSRHEYRPRHGLKCLYRLITDDDAWAAHREKLRREYEKRTGEQL